MNEKEKLIKAYQEGETVEKIAAKYAIPLTMLTSILKASGVKMRKARRYGMADTPEKETLVRLYREHKSLSKVAEVFGVSSYGVTQWFNNHNIPYGGKKHQTVEDWLHFLER